MSPSKFKSLIFLSFLLFQLPVYADTTSTDLGPNNDVPVNKRTTYVLGFGIQSNVKIEGSTSSSIQLKKQCESGFHSEYNVSLIQVDSGGHVGPSVDINLIQLKTHFDANNNIIYVDKAYADVPSYKNDPIDFSWTIYCVPDV